MSALSASFSVELARHCPVCGLTGVALRDGGRMGCAACYETFPNMVREAIQTLHGVAVPAIPAEETAPPPLSPWPTQRASARK